MGITNFCKFINPLHESEPPDRPEYFDSILYDVQPLIHIGISSSLQKHEPQVLNEVCQLAWKRLQMSLLEILPLTTATSVTLILSFDGEGVPMKWPTQRERRLNNNPLDLKTKYRMALFGVNTITLQIQNYFRQKMKSFLFPHVQQLHIYISGCNAPGEGEHKIFQIAEALNTCHHPLVVSVDQDVFILTLMRLSRYETIQIYRYGRYYPVTRLYREWLPYSMKHLEYISFLFGNDFIPTFIGITPINVPDIHQSLQHMDVPDHPTHILAQFINNMSHCIRFQRVTHLDTLLLESFWITYFWIRDYYTQTTFPQKYLENPIYDSFDRNQLLTALSDAEISLVCFENARRAYDQVTREPTTRKQAEYAVFVHDDILNQLSLYWVPPTNAACTVLHLTKKSSRATSLQ
ncbi:hypothetical protein JTE90_016317 [Oedothorax gibbosus]|uniref:Xrn1 N-terminal domain-containing protein n=1 Tax=Oedothorax gibbosus TaxID=931172 RepID=A0AAV6TPY8_9ARAC|nr:hypothetical protein JTE90_016317 [Oedothorax gibbosus]